MGRRAIIVYPTTALLLIAAALCCTGALAQAQAPKRCDAKGFKPADGKPRLFLYVWAGVEGTPSASGSSPAAVALERAPATSPAQAKDFVATIDVTEGSPCFGQVVSEAEVPTAGNEPHHVGLNQDGTVLGVGGFNSWRFKQPSLYFFDVGTDPAQPRFLKAITPTQGAVADDFIRLPNGGFVVSLMGDTNGGGTGRVAEIDANLNLVAEHPKSGKNTEGFNPHGLALTPGPINRMVTLDYVVYSTTFKPSPQIKYRSTARIWDQKAREIIKVVDLGKSAKGMMTARYIPGAGNGALFFVSAGQGSLYLLDALSGDIKEVYDAKVGEGHCVLTLPFRNSSRIVASIYTTDELRLLDTSNVNALKDLQKVSLPKGSGPHAIVIAPGERLLVTSTYYVQHDGPKGLGSLGVASPFSDRSEKAVRLYTVAADGNSLAPHPKVPIINFKTEFPHRGIARPHGMAFKAVPTKR